MSKRSHGGHQYANRRTGRLRGDNPRIRRRKLEARTISVGEPYEVEYARRHRQVVVHEGIVYPVKGKTRPAGNGRIIREDRKRRR